MDERILNFIVEVESQLEQVARDLDKVATHVEALDRMSADIAVILENTEKFLADADRIKEAVQSLDQSQARIDVNLLRVLEVLKEISLIHRRITDLDKAEASMRVSLVGFETLLAEIKKIRQSVESLDKQHADIKAALDGLPELLADIKTINKEVESADRQEIDIPANLDGVIEVLTEIKAVLDMVAFADRQEVDIPVNADGTAETLAELRTLSTFAEQLDGNVIDIKSVLLHVAKHTKELNDLQRQVTSLDGDDARIRVEVDGFREFMAETRKIRQSVQSLERRSMEIKALLDSKDFTAGAKDVEKEVTKLDASEATINIDLSGIERALAEIKDVLTEIKELDRTSATPDVDLEGVAQVFEEIRTILGNMASLNEAQADPEVQLGGAVTVLEEIREILDAMRFINVQEATPEVDLKGDEQTLLQLAAIRKGVDSVDEKNVHIRAALFKAVEVLNQLSAIQTQVANTDGDEASIRVDLVGFEKLFQEFHRIRLSVESLEKKAINILAKLDDTGFKRDAKQVESTVVHMDGTEAKITVDLSGVEKVLAEIKDVLKQMHSLDREKAQPTIELKEVSKVLGEMKLVTEELNKVGRNTATPHVELVGMQQLLTQLAELTFAVNRLDGRNINIKANLKNGRRVIGEMHTINQNINDINNRGGLHILPSDDTALVVLAVLSGVLTPLVPLVAGLVGQLGSLADILGTGLVGAAGLAVGAFVEVRGSLGLFGMAVQSAINLTGGLASTLRTQKSLTDAAKDAVDNAKKAVEAATPGTKAYKDAQNQLKIATMAYNTEQEKTSAILNSLTPNVVELFGKVGDLEVQFIKMRGSMANAVAPTMIAGIEALNKLIPAVTPRINEMVKQMGAVVQSFIKAESSGQRLTNLQTIFNGIVGSGKDTMTILTNAISILAAGLATIIPDSSTLLHNIAQLTTQAEKWVNSAEGMKTLGHIWDDIRNTTERLGGVFKDLGVGLINFFSILRQSGLTGNLFNSIENLAEAFAHVTAKGTESRKAIVGFFKDIQPTMAAAWHLVGRLATELFRMANEVTHMRDENGKLVVPQFFKDLESILPDIRRLLETTFLQVGSKIPAILDEIVKALQAIADTGIPGAIASTILALLKAFNSLPAPIKTAAAAAVIFGLAFRRFGGPLVGFIRLLGKIPGGVRTVAAAFAALKGGQGIAGVLTALGLLKKKGLEPTDKELQNKEKDADSTTKSFGRFGQMIKGLGPLLAGMAAGLGPKLLGGLKNLPTILKGAMGKIPGLLRSALGSTGTIFRPLLTAARGIGPALARAFAGIGGAGGVAAGAGGLALFKGWQLEIDKFRTNIMPKVEALGPDIQAAVKKGMNTGNWSDLWDPLGEAIGQIGKLQSPAGAVTAWLLSPIDRLLKNWHIDIEWPWEQRQNSIESSIKGIKDIGPFFKGLWNTVKRVTGPAWNQIKQTVSNGVTAVAGVLRGIGGRVRGPLAAAWNTVKNVTRTAWNGIKTVVRAIVFTTVGLIIMAWNRIKGPIQAGLRIVGNAIKAGWNGIKNATRAAWNAIVGVVRGVWNKIKGPIAAGVAVTLNVIRTGWNRVKNITRGVWNAVVGVVRGAWNKIKAVFRSGGLISRLIQGIWQRVKNVTSTVWNGIKNFLRNTWNNIKKIAGAALAVTVAQVRRGWNAVKRATSTVWNGIKGLLRQAWNFIKRIFGPALNAIKGIVQRGWNVIRNITRTVWNAIKNFLRGVWKGFMAQARPILNALKNVFRVAWNGIKSATQATWNVIKNFLRGVWRGFMAQARPILNGLKNVFRAAWNAIKAVTTAVWNTIRSFLRGVWRGFVSMARSTVHAVLSIFRGFRQVGSIIRNALQSAINAVKGFAKMMYNLGKQAIQGLINGIKSAAGAVGTAIGNLLKNAYNKGKQAIQSHSPSRLFAKGIGQPISQGVAQGVRSAGGAVNRSIIAVIKASKGHGVKGMQAMSRALQNAATTAAHQGLGPLSARFSQLNRDMQESAKKYHDVGGAMNWAGQQMGVMLKQFQEAGPKMRKLLSDLQFQIGGAFSDQQAFNPDAFANAFNALPDAARKKLFDTIPSRIKDALDAQGFNFAEDFSIVDPGFYDGVKKASKAMDSMKSFPTALAKGWNDMLDNTGWGSRSDMPDKIKKILRDAGFVIAEDASIIGRNTAKGFENGIRAGKGGISQASAEAAMEAIQRAKQQLGIHSPSSVFDTDVGQPIPLGIVQGITKTGPKAVEALRKLLNGLNNQGKNVKAGDGGNFFGGILAGARKMGGQLKNTWNQIMNQAKQAWGKLPNFIRNPIQSAVNLAKSIARGAGNIWDSAVNKAGQIWKKMPNFVRHPIQSAVNLAKSIARGAGNIWDAAVNRAGQIWKKMPNFVRHPVQSAVNLAKRIARGAGNIWNQAVNKAGQIWKKMPNFVRHPVQSAVNLAKKIARSAGNLWDAAVRKAGNAWKKMPNFVRHPVQSAVNLAKKIARGAGNMWNDAMNKARRAWNQLPNFIRHPVQAGVNLAKKIAHGARNIWNDAINNARKTWSKMPEIVRHPLQTAQNFVKTHARQIATSVKTNFNQMVSQAKANWTKFKKDVGDAWTNTVNATKKGAQNVLNTVRSRTRPLGGIARSAMNIVRSAFANWGPIISAVNKGLSNVRTSLSNFAKSMGVLGHNIVVGLANGISKASSIVSNAITSVINAAKNAANRASQSHSPSRLFEREVGIFIPQGMARGITRGKEAVIRAIRDVIRSGSEVGQRGMHALYDALNKAEGAADMAGLDKMSLRIAQISDRVADIGVDPNSTRRDFRQITELARQEMRKMLRGLNTEASKFNPRALAKAWNALSDATRFRRGEPPEHVWRRMSKAGYALAEDLTWVKKSFYGADRAQRQFSSGQREGRKATAEMVRAHRAAMDAFRAFDRARTASLRDGYLSRRERQLLEERRMMLRHYRQLESEAYRHWQRTKRLNIGAVPHSLNLGPGGQFGESTPTVRHLDTRRANTGTLRFQAGAGSKDELHVYVHALGPFADQVDNETLASNIAKNVKNRRRRS